jgi:hypothetical protein
MTQDAMTNPGLRVRRTPADAGACRACGRATCSTRKEDVGFDGRRQCGSATSAGADPLVSVFARSAPCRRVDDPIRSLRGTLYPIRSCSINGPMAGLGFGLLKILERVFRHKRFRT